MSASEWVEYQACPREVRHLRLGDEPCRLCRHPVRADRALTSAGKFHWLVWQQHLVWPDRHRPGQVLDLTSGDFVAWAAGDPAGHRAYLDFLDGAAAFRPEDFVRPTRGYLLGPGRPPTTVILQPDGAIDRPDRTGPARWGCDPAGVLVLYVDRVQYRIVGRRRGLHVGRAVTHGTRAGEPAVLGLWSDMVTETAVRVTGREATVLGRRHGDAYAEQDLFVGAGERVSVLGPERRVSLDPAPGQRWLGYRGAGPRVELEGGPVYRGSADHIDWRLAFLRPLGPTA